MQQCLNIVIKASGKRGNKEDENMEDVSGTADRQ